MSSNPDKMRQIYQVPQPISEKKVFRQVILSFFQIQSTGDFVKKVKELPKENRPKFIQTIKKLSGHINSKDLVDYLQKIPKSNKEIVRDILSAKMPKILNNSTPAEEIGMEVNEILEIFFPNSQTSPVSQAHPQVPPTLPNNTAAAQAQQPHANQTTILPVSQTPEAESIPQQPKNNFERAEIFGQVIAKARLGYFEDFTIEDGEKITVPNITLPTNPLAGDELYFTINSKNMRDMIVEYKVIFDGNKWIISDNTGIQGGGGNVKIVDNQLQFLFLKQTESLRITYIPTKLTPLGERNRQEKIAKAEIEERERESIEKYLKKSLPKDSELEGKLAKLIEESSTKELKEFEAKVKALVAETDQILGREQGKTLRETVVSLESGNNGEPVKERLADQVEEKFQEGEQAELKKLLQNPTIQKVITPIISYFANNAIGKWFQNKVAPDLKKLNDFKNKKLNDLNNFKNSFFEKQAEEAKVDNCIGLYHFHPFSNESKIEDQTGGSHRIRTHRENNPKPLDTQKQIAFAILNGKVSEDLIAEQKAETDAEQAIVTQKQQLENQIATLEISVDKTELDIITTLTKSENTEYITEFTEKWNLQNPNFPLQFVPIQNGQDETKIENQFKTWTDRIKINYPGLIDRIGSLEAKKTNLEMSKTKIDQIFLDLKKEKQKAKETADFDAKVEKISQEFQAFWNDQNVPSGESKWKLFCPKINMPYSEEHKNSSPNIKDFADRLLDSNLDNAGKIAELERNIKIWKDSLVAAIDEDTKNFEAKKEEANFADWKKEQKDKFKYLLLESIPILNRFRTFKTDLQKNSGDRNWQKLRKEIQDSLSTKFQDEFNKKLIDSSDTLNSLNPEMTQEIIDIVQKIFGINEEKIQKAPQIPQTTVAQNSNTDTLVGNSDAIDVAVVTVPDTLAGSEGNDSWTGDTLIGATRSDPSNFENFSGIDGNDSVSSGGAWSGVDTTSGVNSGDVLTTLTTNIGGQARKNPNYSGDILVATTDTLQGAKRTAEQNNTLVGLRTQVLGNDDSLEAAQSESVRTGIKMPKVAEISSENLKNLSFEKKKELFYNMVKSGLGGFSSGENNLIIPDKLSVQQLWESLKQEEKLAIWQKYNDPNSIYYVQSLFDEKKDTVLGFNRTFAEVFENPTKSQQIG